MTDRILKLAGLSLAVFSCTAGADIVLDTITVNALPGDGKATAAQQPVTVLGGEELDNARASSLGDTLAQQPGIQNAGFGAAVGRPVVRGMGGSRLKILEDGLEAADASGVSPDHAVAVDTRQASQIEVLRGPATLLYGSGAIGGVVNVVGNEHKDGTELRLGYDSVNQGRLFGAGFGASSQRWQWSIGASEYRSGDYQIPEEAGEIHREDGELEYHDAESDRLENSDIEHQRHVNSVLTYLGDRSETSVTLAWYDSAFGLPGHGHEEEEGASEEEHEEEGDARVSMEKLRIALQHTQYQPLAWVEEWQTDVSVSQYEHSEGHETEHEEGETEAEHEAHGLTTFAKDTLALRSQFILADQGRFRQVAGVDSAFEAFEAEGGEALMPSTDTSRAGLFWLGEYGLERLRLSGGLRYDYTAHDPEAGDVEAVCGFDVSDVRAQNFSDVSASLGAGFAFNDIWSLQGNITSAARAPASEELYSCGPHESTFTYEVGNPDLDSERALNTELALEMTTDRIVATLAIYRNLVDDYIYAAALAEGGTLVEEDELPVYVFTQNNALMRGAEAQLAIRLSDRWQWGLMADRVRGTVLGEGYLPRMPADRVGTDVEYQTAAFSAVLDWKRYLDQDRTAGSGIAEELPTEGFDMVNLSVNYRLIRAEAEYAIGVKGTNLLNEVVRYHPSFVKDRVPGAGRGFSLNLSAAF